MIKMTIEHISYNDTHLWCVYEEGSDMTDVEFIPFNTPAEAIMYCEENGYDYQVVGGIENE